MCVSSIAIPATVPSPSRVPNNDTCSSCQVLLWCGICSLTGGWDVTFSFKASLLLGHSSAYAASLWHPLVSLHQGIIRLKTARMCTSCEKVSMQSSIFWFLPHPPGSRCAHKYARMKRYEESIIIHKIQDKFIASYSTQGNGTYTCKQAKEINQNEDNEL